MVKIIGYKSIQTKNENKFFVLILQGGIELVKSQTTSKNYFTARTVNISTTFDEETCKGLVGNELEGKIIKISCEPYEYTIKETGELIILSYRYEFVDNIHEIYDEQVIEEELVQ